MGEGREERKGKKGERRERVRGGEGEWYCMCEWYSQKSKCSHNSGGKEICAYSTFIHMCHPPGYSELHTAISQIFGSPISMALLGSAFREVCYLRLCLCRDILVMLHVMRRGGASEVRQWAGRGGGGAHKSIIQAGVGIEGSTVCP